MPSQEVQNIADDINEIVQRQPASGSPKSLVSLQTWLEVVQNNENFTPASSPTKPKKRKSSEKHKSRGNESSDVEIVGTLPPKPPLQRLPPLDPSCSHLPFPTPTVAKSQTIRPPTMPVPPPVAPMLPQPETSLLSNDSLMLRFLLSNTNPLLGMQLQSNIFPPLPALPPAPPTPAVLSPPSAATPIKLTREITIEEYCDRYQINDDERRVLEELEYIPGDVGLT
ncbi:hypothetical protein B0H11DRAFT_1945828 [Mycena galericulata]|nr:hypothetical protein B0H11DRAFT_1945828 [Mycena galericulata]